MQNRKVLKWVLVGTSVLGLSYLSYRFWTNWTRSQTVSRRKISDEEQEEPRLKTIQSNYSQFYFDKEEQLRKVLNRLDHKGPQIQQLYLLSPLILIDEYIKYTKQIRKRRRLIRKTNEEQYIGLIRNYEFQVRELLQRGRQEVAQQCGRSIDDLQRMQTAYEMFENLQDLKKRAHQELLIHANPAAKLRRVPKEKLRRIMEEEINFLTNRMHERIKTKLLSEEVDATPEETHRIIQTLIDDIVYEKYGYEREEIEKQIEEFPLLARDLKKCRNNLFAEIGHFSMDSMESPGQSDDEGEDKNNMSNSAKTQILEDSKEG